MTKRELIDEIVAINHTASPQFLARFQDGELDEYLTHLRVLSSPRLSGDAARYEKYFRNCPKAVPARPLWRTDSERIEEILTHDPRAARAPQQATPAAANAAVQAPPADQEELTCMSVSPAEREQLLAELDDAAEAEDLAADLEDRLEQDDEPLQALTADTPADLAEQQDYIPQPPLAQALTVQALAETDARSDDEGDQDDDENEDDDLLAEEDEDDGFIDYTVNCDSDLEQPPQADYVPVSAHAQDQPEPAGVAADQPTAPANGRKDDSENWLF